MLFNSLDFAVFLPVVFILYWFVFNRSVKLQNGLLLLASYVFYGWWDYRFLSLIIISSVVDFLVGLGIANTSNPGKRLRLLWVSILVNLGFLGYFKYYNFFLDSFIEAFSLFGGSLEPRSLSIILPVGISFYTFQTLSYSLDIYKKKLTPTRDFVAFFTFVGFFPQLVAGPIERAGNLLPQFSKKRSFDYDQATDGMRQILWGLSKKVVIADNCAEFVNPVFANSQDQSGSTLVMGAVFFAFQIYGDFSGYSDIAIGTAKLFGFRLMTNFSLPYFSRDIAEFWRRWHISLSTWFRDYVYIPLGGSRGSAFQKTRNTFVIFLVSGFWHGANWTFVLWGGLHALYFLPLLITRRNRKNRDQVAEGRSLPTFMEVFKIVRTFLLVTLAWIFFRSESIGAAFDYLQSMLSGSILSVPAMDIRAVMTIGLNGALIGIEWIRRSRPHPLHFKNERPLIRRLTSLAVVLLIFFFGVFNKSEFIYFQF